MENNERAVSSYPERRMNLGKLMGRKKGLIYALIGLVVLSAVWFIAAKLINRSLVLPDFVETMAAFAGGWVSPKVMGNLWITLVRVFKGFVVAVAIGMPLGLLMGASRTALEALSPFVNSIRQVPIMAWVPLSIIWFGLGDGPTIFLIAMSAVFPLMLNVISGVMGIDPNYLHAAQSMGASRWEVFRDIIIPGSLPSFLTGCRLAMGLAWMSVICAEFIATSEGFGFIMVEAQVRMETPQLYALMIMSAIVGFAVDRVFLIAEKHLTGWRFKNGTSEN